MPAFCLRMFYNSFGGTLRQVSSEYESWGKLSMKNKCYNDGNHKEGVCDSILRSDILKNGIKQFHNFNHCWIEIDKEVLKQSYNFFYKFCLVICVLYCLVL